VSENRIEPCWPHVGPELAAEIVALWRQEKAIDTPAEMQRRSAEAVCVARGADGTLLGVATAQAQLIPFLGQPMYYLRAFVAANARRGILGYRLMRGAQETLAADAASAAPASAAIGIFLELENPAFARDGDRAVWRSGFAYAGITPRGLQRRIWYFPEARLRR